MLKTVLFSFPSDPLLHYSIYSKRETRCGIDLRKSQPFLEYNVGEKDICPRCAYKNIPQLKDWNPTIKIACGEHAKRCLHHLYILLQNLEEELQIYWDIYEYQMYGCNDLSNWLLNDEPNIEGFDEGKQEVQVSYRHQASRETRFIEFEKIADFYQRLKKDVMWMLNRYACEPENTLQVGHGPAYWTMRRLQILSSLLSDEEIDLLGLQEALDFDEVNIIHFLDDSDGDVIACFDEKIKVKYLIETGEKESVILIEKIHYFIKGIKNNMNEILQRRRN